MNNSNDKDNNEDLARPSTYFKDIPPFAIIVFIVPLMTAALVNTQAAMKQIAHVLVFFGSWLSIGYADQSIGWEK